jgi:hypothetical protein
MSWFRTSATTPASARAQASYWDRVTPLHFFDDVGLYRDMSPRQIWVYDAVLDPEVLRRSLCRLLDRDDGWRRVGSRIRVSGTGKLEQVVPERFGAGREPVQFSCVDFGVRIGEHPVASRLPARRRGGGSDAAGGTGRPRVCSGEMAEFEGLFRSGATSLAFRELVERDVSRVVLHVVSFRDATVVVLSWNHTLSDVVGMGALLRNWRAVLEGREAEVERVNDGRVDLLEGVGSAGGDGYQFVGMLLSTWGFVAFVLFQMWDWVRNCEPVVRAVYVPGRWIEGVKATAAADGGDEKERISDNDVLSALFTRMAALGGHPEQMCALSMAADMRPILPALQVPKGVATIGNYSTGFWTFMTVRDVVGSSVGRLTRTIRRSVIAHKRPDQIEALTAIWRGMEQKGLASVYGKWNMRWLVASNWSRGGAFELDLSAARVDGGKAGPLKPSLVLAYNMTDTAMSRMLVGTQFMVEGRDEEGGYWVTAACRKNTWREFERAVASMDE